LSPQGGGGGSKERRKGAQVHQVQAARQGPHPVERRHVPEDGVRV